MKNSLSGELRLCGKSANQVGRWALVGETLEWYLNEQKFKIESGEDLSRNIESFLKILSKKWLVEPMKLHACLTCKEFVMSGMAREMSRGQRGVCTLHQIGVEVCFLCSDYEQSKC